MSFRAISRGLLPLQAIVLGLALFAAAIPSKAQVLYGSVVGTVTDSTGAVIPGASVTLTNQGTSQSLSASTDGSGSYTFSNVLAGTYDLNVQAEGFGTVTEEGIVVTVNRVRRNDVSLELGSVTETVTVAASALALQTEKTDVNAEINSKEVVNMPLPNYRNYQSLINLVPGATPGRFQNSVGSSPGRSLSTNVNGVNRNNNVTKVDGAASIFIWLPHHAQYISPAETVETVNISTNNFDAEQGMAGGAAVTVQTKSGTNEFHGSAFEFHDNQKLRARNFFSADKPRSTKNIYGFTAGGPIVKNKLFFFGGMEAYRERLGFERLNMTVAPLDQRGGDFSAYGTNIYDPMTGNADGTGREQFANNIIPEQRLSQIALEMQSLVPAPMRSSAQNNLDRSGTQVLDRYNYDTKINWNVSDSFSLWGKYSMMDAVFDCEAALGAAQGVGLCSGAAGRNTTLDQTSTIGWTKTFSPFFLWDATVGWTRHGNNSGDFVQAGVNFGSDVLGIPGTNGPDIRQSGIPEFGISGYDTLGNPNGWQPNYYGDTTFTIDQNFSMIKGSHNMRFGFQGMRHHLNHWQPEIGGGPRGEFTFSQGVTGLAGGPATSQVNAYAAYLLGMPGNMAKSLQWEKMSAFNLQLGLFFRDTWQVSPKLIMTMGLRWEKFPLQTRAGRGGIEWWDPETNLIYLGGAGGTPKDVGVSTSNKMFAPRLGLAYKLTDKMVVRSGYGITYNPMPFARPLRGFYPLTIAQDFPADNAWQPAGTLETGIPEFSGPDPSVGVTELPSSAINRSISGKDVTRGYVQSWNFIVESELPADFIGSIGYVGTRTVNSFADLELNYARPGGGTAGRQLNQQFGRVANTLAWNGRVGTNYHSLQATINRRVAEGLTIKGAYTWGAAINYTDDDGWAGMSWNIPEMFDRNRARAGFDQNHIFQLGYVYELPFGKGKQMLNSGPASMIFGNWQVNGVFAAFQGRRFTVGASGSALNAPGNSQTADQVKSDVEKIGDIGPGQYFYDPTAFAPVQEVRFGTSGRNIMRAPGVVNLDLSLFRRFPIKERVVLEFRAESYNLTNTPHFNSPTSSVNSGAFFQVTSAAQDQRQMRFALRLEW